MPSLPVWKIATLATISAFMYAKISYAVIRKTVAAVIWDIRIVCILFFQIICKNKMLQNSIRQFMLKTWIPFCCRVNNYNLVRVQQHVHNCTYSILYIDWPIYLLSMTTNFTTFFSLSRGKSYVMTKSKTLTLRIERLFFSMT